ncbi:MAG: winged helix-turn-helix transcriptional regulator [Lachnospiraceae bacterium]
MYQLKLEKDIRCPLEYGLEVFGGKWKSRIICVLANRKVMRYSALRKEMGNITDAVLSSNLKELIGDEMVQRKQYDEIPPKVEYCLTPKGESVLPILVSISQWSGAYCREETDREGGCRNCDYRAAGGQ